MTFSSLKCVTKFFFFCLLLNPQISYGQTTNLGTVAASLQPGQWAELNTFGLTDDLIRVGAGHLLQYADSATWDPIGKRFIFLGGAHANGPNQKLLVYSDATNTWTVGPAGSFFCPPSNDTSCVSHPYDHNTIDPATGNFYYRVFNSNNIWRFRASTNAWDPTPIVIPYGMTVAMGIAWFPDRGGLVIAGGGGAVYFWKESTNTWSNLTPVPYLTMSDYHNWAEYNPVYRAVIFGGSRNFYKMDAAGAITTLANSPVDILIPYETTTVDPVTGNYLSYVADSTGTRKEYKYDLAANTWTPTGAALPWGSGEIGLVATPVSTYGITMFLKYSSGDPRVYIHKDGTGLLPPPTTDSQAPSVPSNLSAVAVSSSQISLSWTASSDNVGVSGYRIYRCQGAGCTPSTQIATSSTTSYSDAGLTSSTSYSYRGAAYDAAGNVSGQTATATATTTNAVNLSPPTSGTVGGYAMPSLQDEKNTYISWGWTWSANKEPAAVTEPIPGYTVSNPDVHGDTEGDDLWTYLMMYRRTGNSVYLNRATAWARYFKQDYRACIDTSSSYDTFCYDRDAFGADHLYGWGLIAWYEQFGDTAALTEAENLGALLESLYAPGTPYGCLPAGACTWYGYRQVGRHLLFATRLAEVTGSSRWAALRDKIIGLLLASGNWDTTYGMYFVGGYNTDEALGAGAYAAGARVVSPFQIGVLSEAMFKAYRATGNTQLRDRLISMARFVDQYGLDTVYQYTGSVFGIVNGQKWHNYSASGTATFWDPVYTTSLVNLLVLGYKYTGDIAFYNRAKYFFNRGTKGEYGSPTIRIAADNVVANFIDTVFDSSSGNFYLAYNKGELVYTYLLFENGGSPTVETGSNSPPQLTVSITAPTANTSVSGTSINVSASATANLGIAGVQFRLDGTNLGAEDTTAPYSTTWNSTQSTNGAHNLTAIARDVAGNQITSAAVTVTVNNIDAIAPTVSLTVPVAGTTVAGAAVTVSAAATDNVGIVGVQFKLDNANLGSEDTTAPYSMTWNTAQTTNGTHTLTAVARDAAGNQTTSTAVTVTVNNTDITPPTVSVTAPTAGATVAGTTVTISASAADNVGVVGVQFKLDGAALGSEDMAAPYSITWNSTQTNNGTHTVTAVARDAAGNQTMSAGVNITVNNVDATAPVVLVTAPAASATVSGASVTVSASASDNIGVAGVQFKLDGAALGSEDTTVPYSITWNTTQTANGNHILTAVARDAAGNQATSAGVTVIVNNVDTVAPAVAMTAPTTGATVAGASVTVSASASDNVGVVGVQFSLDGFNLAPEDMTSPYSITWNTAQSSNGSHTLTAVARDAGGNKTTSAGITVTVNNTDTSAPTVSITAPAAGTSIGDNPITLSATASDNVGVVGVQFKLDGTAIGSEDVTAPYSITWNPAQTPNGPHTLTAVASDATGNQTTSAGVAVTVNNSDAIAPTVSVTSPSIGATVSSNYLVLSASASDNIGVVGVQFLVDGVNLGPEDTTPPYSATWILTGIPSGTHTLVAVARDIAGNRTTSLPVTVTVNPLDATAPTVSMVAPSSGSTVVDSVTLTASVSDNVGVTGVWFTLDGVNLGSELTSAPFTISWDTTQSTNGPHTINVWARDAAGNLNTSAVTITVNNVDPTASLKYSVADRGAEVWIGSSGSLPLTTGYARVQSDTGSASPAGIAIFGYRSNGVLVSEASVPASPLIQSGRIYVQVDGPANTGIAIANPNDQDSVISFFFTSTSGTDFGNGSFTLGVGRQLSAFLNEAPFNGRPNMEGTFTFTASRPVSAVALRGYTNERSEFLITTLPVSNLASESAGTQLVAPHFATGGGWTTELVLVNPTDVILTGTISFFDSGSTNGSGSLMSLTVNGTSGSTFNYLITPRSSIRFDLKNATGEVKVGSIRVNAIYGMPLPSGVAIFSYTTNGVRISEASVPLQREDSAFRVYADSFGALGAVGSVRTGIAIANVSASPVVATVELTTTDGSGLSTSFAIPAGGQIARFIHELIPYVPATFAGVLRITTSAPVVAVGLRGTVNERGDFLITTTFPVAESGNVTGQELLFPHIVRGGGYTTDLIIFGRSAALSTSGKIVFYSKDGVPLSWQ